MMDADLLHRFYLKGAKFKYINYDIGLFRLGGVTNDDWKKKIPEKRALIRCNGGGLWIEYLSVSEFVLRNIIKGVCYKVLGGNVSRGLRY